MTQDTPVDSFILSTTGAGALSGLRDESTPEGESHLQGGSCDGVAGMPQPARDTAAGVGSTKAPEADLDTAAQEACLGEFVSRFSGGAPPQLTPEPLCVGVCDGFVLRGALSREECLFLRSRVGYNEDISYNNNEGHLYRKNLRQQIPHEGLAAWLMDRVGPHLPEGYTVAAGEKEFGPRAEGEWRRTGLNASLRFCKYDPGGRFLPHYDGIFIRSVAERSLWTLMFYLNTDFEGGRTRFLLPDTRHAGPGGEDAYDEFASLHPGEGDCICFPVNLLHEGGAVQRGEKFILRTDVLFEREAEGAVGGGGGEGVCNLPPAPGQSREARAAEFLELAREYERCRNPEAAVECYRKAIRLDPRLEHLI